MTARVNIKWSGEHLLHLHYSVKDESVLEQLNVRNLSAPAFP